MKTILLNNERLSLINTKFLTKNQLIVASCPSFCFLILFSFLQVLFVWYFFMLYIHVLILFIYLFIFLCLLLCLPKLTAFGLQFDRCFTGRGHGTGGSWLGCGNGWASQVSSTLVSLRLQLLVPLGHYTSICYKGVKQQYFLLDLGQPQNLQSNQGYARAFAATKDMASLHHMMVEKTYLCTFLSK